VALGEYLDRASQYVGKTMPGVLERNDAKNIDVGVWVADTTERNW
jgi:hypothetical protein